MADPNRPYASPFGTIQRGNALADRNYKGASSLPLLACTSLPID